MAYRIVINLNDRVNFAYAVNFFNTVTNLITKKLGIQAATSISLMDNDYITLMEFNRAPAFERERDKYEVESKAAYDKQLAHLNSTGTDDAIN